MKNEYGAELDRNGYAPSIIPGHDDMRLYQGIRVIETNAITKKIQRRTHHKKRINKKWLKRYGYRIIPDDEKVYLIGGCIYGTPKAIKKLEKIMEGE